MRARLALLCLPIVIGFPAFAEEGYGPLIANGLDEELAIGAMLRIVNAGLNVAKEELADARASIAHVKFGGQAVFANTDNNIPFFGILTERHPTRKAFLSRLMRVEPTDQEFRGLVEPDHLETQPEQRLEQNLKSRIAETIRRVPPAPSELSADRGTR